MRYIYLHTHIYTALHTICVRAASQTSFFYLLNKGTAFATKSFSFIQDHRIENTYSLILASTCNAEIFQSLFPPFIFSLPFLIPPSPHYKILVFQQLISKILDSRMHGIPQDVFHSHQHTQEELQKVAV